MPPLVVMQGDYRIQVLLAKHKPLDRRHEWSIRHMPSGRERFGSSPSQEDALNAGRDAIAVLRAQGEELAA